MGTMETLGTKGDDGDRRRDAQRGLGKSPRSPAVPRVLMVPIVARVPGVPRVPGAAETIAVSPLLHARTRAE